ncbi:MAG: hypothetical protein JXD23_04345 [Spirochaetales bacterium]|nr:hypothetical protein [Spirochaetales bacterium]
MNDVRRALKRRRRTGENRLARIEIGLSFDEKRVAFDFQASVDAAMKVAHVEPRTGALWNEEKRG